MKTDELVRKDVITELERDPSLPAAGIGVGVHEGIVTLSGHVENFAQKRAAEKACQRVYGVRGVAEELKVVLPDNHVRTDEDIARAAANALQWDVMVPHNLVHVTVENGWLTLEGKLDYGFQKRSAEKAVRNLYGVKGISNLIQTKPHADPASVIAEIERTLRLAAERDAHKVKVEAEDGTVRLTGTVRSFVEREDAARAAWNAPGVAKVENYITIGT